jgi:hypothetical protein
MIRRLSESGSRMRQKECVVIGAGLAGLAAAYRLSQKNWKVTILEAADRIGGRVMTYHFDGAPGLNCELGGEWIGTDHKELTWFRDRCRFRGANQLRHRVSRLPATLTRLCFAKTPSDVDGDILSPPRLGKFIEAQEMESRICEGRQDRMSCSGHTPPQNPAAAAFRLLYCFFVISHDRRRTLHLNVTRHPTNPWIIQQLREAFPFQHAPRLLIFDRDAKYGFELPIALRSMSITPVRT